MKVAFETTAGISAKKAIETVQNGGLNGKEQLRMIAFVAWKTKWLKAIDSLYVKINDEQEHHRSITWRGVYPKQQLNLKVVGCRRFGPRTSQTLMMRPSSAPVRWTSSMDVVATHRAVQEACATAIRTEQRTVIQQGAVVTGLSRL